MLFFFFFVFFFENIVFFLVLGTIKTRCFTPLLNSAHDRDYKKTSNGLSLATMVFVYLYWLQIPIGIGVYAYNAYIYCSCKSHIATSEIFYQKMVISKCFRVVISCIKYCARKKT